MGQTLGGAVVILVVGLAVLAVATAVDWYRDTRARAAVLPKIQDDADDVPEYVTVNPEDLPARHVLSDEESRQLDADLATDLRLDLPARLADERLTTHLDPVRSIVRGALVLVCPDGIGSVAEVLKGLELARAHGTPMVLAAPWFDPELVDTLVVNMARGLLTSVPLLCPPQACTEVAEATGASPVSRADLQAGDVPPSVYGRALLVVADTQSCVLVAAQR